MTDIRLDALGTRLAARAQASVAAHRSFRTVRRADLRYRPLTPGCAVAPLQTNEESHTALLRLAAGEPVPWLAGTTAQELLVVAGAVEAQPAGAPPTSLPRHGLALRRAANAGALVAADGPATVYLRSMRVATESLPPDEAHWWALARTPLVVVDPGRRRWLPTFPGVEVLPLWGDPAVTSMLVRFAPGASVPDHSHAVNEDCLMLEGEMHLGDILLQPGDYQLAQAGGGHVGECSDVGGTFFFHGAIDPVLVPPAASTDPARA